MECAYGIRQRGTVIRRISTVIKIYLRQVHTLSLEKAQDRQKENWFSARRNMKMLWGEAWRGTVARSGLLIPTNYPRYDTHQTKRGGDRGKDWSRSASRAQKSLALFAAENDAVCENEALQRT